jgi:hypothetical protein
MDARRRLAIAAAAAAVLVLAGVTVGLVVTGEPGETVGETTRTITPAEPTAESTRSVVPTYTVPATPAPPGTAGGGGTGESAPRPGDVQELDPGVWAPVVAYRRHGWLCVAAEDGTGERRVVESESGVFSLSPDGSTIALISEADGRLALVSVADGEVRTIGEALQDVPAWSPDSKSVAYTAPGPRVYRVDGGAAVGTFLFSGRGPSYARDGGSIVGIAVADDARPIVLWHGGELSAVRVPGPVSAVACDGTMLYYGTAPDGARPASLRQAGLDGSGERVLVSAPDSPRAVVFACMLLAPNGRYLSYAEHGDDGYSRAFSIPVAGGAPLALSLRRDTYPLRWDAGSDALLMIEGNPLQGEEAALVRVSVAGAARRYLREDVSR